MSGTPSTAIGQASAAPSSLSPTAGNFTYPRTTIGLAVGLPLGFLLLASVGILIWREHKGKRKKEVTQQQSTAGISERIDVLEGLLKRISPPELVGVDARGKTWHELPTESLHELAAKEDNRHKDDRQEGAQRIH
ncbi:hypothetical protein EV356DRAFT_508364 [Viridothelium virens]|uniref:Uncharacterized protein n=1 Tax=Viridothelium virens TaxID=1048519 RepID=A0A6A6GZ19_VIRVR|nr:hypothetical protein EV356DRAFT_508364 [Viridothelium virens]